MSNTNTKNVLRLPAKLADSVYASLSDGKFNIADFGNFIDDFTAVKPAIDSFKGMKEENIQMGIDERKELQGSVESEMQNVDPSDRYDIASAMTGVLSMFRVGWRKGATAERARLKEALKNGSITVESLLSEED